MSYELDLLDRKILFELDCNSRRSLSEISRKVGLGRDLVSYRIEKLQDLGVVKRFHAIINPYKLGLTVFKTYLKLHSQKGKWREFVSLLDEHPSTAWLAECYGKWDVVWCLYAHSPKEVYDIHDALLSQHRDIILASNVCTTVNHWWFPKKYLRSTSSETPSEWKFELPEFTTGTTPALEELDHIERGILRVLSSNARTNIKEMAEELSTTPAVIKYRTERLEQRGIITGYRLDIDRALLGMTLFKVQIQQGNYDSEIEREFHEYCKFHPQIAEYIQQLGDCRIECVIEAVDYSQFNSIVDELRDRFGGFIRNLEYMMIRKDYFHRTPPVLYEVPVDQLSGKRSKTNGNFESAALYSQEVVPFQ
ncbi:MAG: Lrp/AsnC family transcriptional regulator [Bdellovibrionales bacterium]|nr:Lrp/AsnC family transcriptional regulator [Bdellovibrionales bacterium]